MTPAGAALQAAIVGALKTVPDLGAVYDGPPVQAAFPHALVDAGVATDWSTKSETGRDVRIAVTIRGAGERPTRLHRLMAAAEAAVADVSAADGWAIVALRFVASRVVRNRDGWAGVMEFRARMTGDG